MNNRTAVLPIILVSYLMIVLDIFTAASLAVGAAILAPSTLALLSTNS